jgi:glutaryl-CoA dehydrogenase
MSHSELPATSDFYSLESTLPDRDRALLADVRGFMREEVAPIINDYWSREEFPHHVFPAWLRSGWAGWRSRATAARAAASPQ